MKAITSFSWGRCLVILSHSITVWYGKSSHKQQSHLAAKPERFAERSKRLLCFGLYNQAMLGQVHTSRISDLPVSQKENRNTARSQHKYSHQERYAACMRWKHEEINLLCTWKWNILSLQQLSGRQTETAQQLPNTKTPEPEFTRAQVKDLNERLKSQIQPGRRSGTCNLLEIGFEINVLWYCTDLCTRAGGGFSKPAVQMSCDHYRWFGTLKRREESSSMQITKNPLHLDIKLPHCLTK